jgi:hypothetical protein
MTPDMQKFTMEMHSVCRPEIDGTFTLIFYFENLPSRELALFVSAHVENAIYTIADNREKPN